MKPSQHSNFKSGLKDKYLPLVAASCLQQFCVDKLDPQKFKEYLMKDVRYSDPAQKPSAEKIDRVIAAGRQEEFEEMLTPLTIHDLKCVSDVIDYAEFKNPPKENFKTFYKVTFEKDPSEDPKITPTVTPLAENQIWDTAFGGLDKTEDFIVINPDSVMLIDSVWWGWIRISLRLRLAKKREILRKV